MYIDPQVTAKTLEIDPQTILTSGVLEVMGIAAVLGVIGGAARLARSATDEKPTRWKIAAGLFIGAIAAIAAFYVLAPTTPLKFVAACVIAGYSGPALLDAIETRFKLVVAEAKVKRLADAGARAVAIADEAVRSGGPAMSPSPHSHNELATRLDVLRTEFARAQG